MKNNDKYVRRFATLSNSGCGVVFTRTSEPFRCMDALKQFAFSRNLPYADWNHVEGWRMRQPTDEPDAKPEVTKLTDPYQALKWIADVDGEGQNAKTAGVFVMHATHPWLSKHPGMVECLRHYVRDFAELTKVRLVLVSPDSANLPDELQHDMPIVDFDLPSQEEMEEILGHVIESCTPEDDEVPEMFSGNERATVVASAGGLTQMEAELAFSEAIVTHRPEEGNWHDIAFADFNNVVLRTKTEVIKQSDVLELMEPVDMKDVGGLDAYKAWIERAASVFDKAARDFGCDMPKGIAAIGPPGTGKTLLGKATATTFGNYLVKFDMSRVFNKYVGESEARVRAALKMLEAMGRVTVLFDEVDKGLGGSHMQGGDSGVSSRVLGSILTFMQETKAPIFPIFTANRTAGLPPELLRKGRLDQVFAVMPPNKVEREAVLSIHLRKRGQKVPKDLHLAVQASRGYVSSELEAAVKESVWEAYHTGQKVTGALLTHFLQDMRPLCEAFPEDFQAMSEWAVNNAKLASTPIEDEVGVTPALGGGGGERRRRRRAVVANQG